MVAGYNEGATDEKEVNLFNSILAVNSHLILLYIIHTFLLSNNNIDRRKRSEKLKKKKNEKNKEENKNRKKDEMYF